MVRFLLHHRGTMWRKQTFAALRIINSKKYPFPRSDSLSFIRFYRNFSLLHYSSSHFNERFGGSPFLSARTSFFPSPTVLFGANWMYILTFDHSSCFFCSESGPVRNSVAAGIVTPRVRLRLPFCSVILVAVFHRSWLHWLLPNFRNVGILY